MLATGFFKYCKTVDDSKYDSPVHCWFVIILYGGWRYSTCLTCWIVHPPNITHISTSTSSIQPVTGDTRRAVTQANTITSKCTRLAFYRNKENYCIITLTYIKIIRTFIYEDHSLMLSLHRENEPSQMDQTEEFKLILTATISTRLALPWSQYRDIVGLL